MDDGKSTLIGRLLYDSKLIFEDQLAALEADSARVGTQGKAIDFALLVDGLAAEREQGITIDVAYRHFATPKRRFVLHDCPGHAQYTRNMVTGASTADLAVILVDARRGLTEQSRRHAALAGLPLSVRELLDQLAGIQETVLIYPSTGGRPKARRMLTETTGTQDQLVEIFDLNRWTPRT